MFTMDAAARIDSWNQGARRIMGYEASEAIGLPGAIIFTPEDRAAGEVVQESLRLTRQLTVELSPPVLQGEGLLEALEWLSKHMHDIYGLETTVTASNHPRVADEDQRILLFQVVRELLFNAVKHAGVTEAHVTLQEEQGGITIRSPAPARR